MLAAALCRRIGCVLVRFVGHGRNERMLDGKRHPNSIRREQELENFLTYYQCYMRPPLISAAHQVLGALESVHEQRLVAHTTVPHIQTSKEIAINGMIVMTFMLEKPPYSGVT